jgi:hypothetical protein
VADKTRDCYVGDLEAILHASLNVVAAGQDEHGVFLVDADSMFALRRAVGRFARLPARRIALERP